MAQFSVIASLVPCNQAMWEEKDGLVFDCLHMRDHFQKNLGICLHLETVGKINMYTSDIRPIYFRIIKRYIAAIYQFNSMNVEDNCCVYEGKDAFLWLPTRFGKSARCCHLRA